MKLLPVASLAGDDSEERSRRRDGMSATRVKQD